MNYQLATVGGLTVLALFAHVFGGIRQSLSVEPAKLTDKEKLANFETLDWSCPDKPDTLKFYKRSPR